VLMNSTTTEINVLELRSLLHDLKDHGRGVCIRFRLLGEMWQTHHGRILTINEKGASVIEESTNKLIFIPDLNNVIQFEIDKPFKTYKPHCHYTVTLT
jgi:hypothetical protein